MILHYVIRAIGKVDNRPAGQIRAEVGEELAHHIECLREELIREGAAADELDAKIAERFGDVQRFAAECTRIAMKERVMIQRVNLCLLIVLGVAVGWTSWSTTQASVRNAAALDKLTAQIHTLGQTSVAPPASPSATAPAATSGSVITVSGRTTVGRPGVYALGKDPLTVRRLLIACQFIEEYWKSGEIEVRRMTPQNKNELVFSLSAEEYRKRDGADFVLMAGDIVQAP